MHHPTDRITHTTAFVTPVVEHWLEREIAQWVHPMKDRSAKDNNARHHRTRVEVDFLQRNAIISILWRAGIPDLNPTENVWNILCQRLRQRWVHNLAEFSAALHQECQATPQHQKQSLVQEMNRRMERVGGGYTRY